jgi:hypothetical protein
MGQPRYITYENIKKYNKEFRLSTVKKKPI